ncbi:hypothetical protein CBM2589_P160013 [Cupriavidus taiwanensis]|uniref:Uncharacterized protein n=1 Tax=Cupriavidus taiwanensis TaxID=164546 RepID=A0A375CME1_9BURK|nr:hypothetical protein CBM2589_P160013 [Cupriavidus taiwanensis]
MLTRESPCTDTVMEQIASMISPQKVSRVGTVSAAARHRVAGSVAATCDSDLQVAAAIVLLGTAARLVRNSGGLQLRHLRVPSRDSFANVSPCPTLPPAGLPLEAKSTTPRHHYRRAREREFPGRYHPHLGQVPAV